jgi:hypothetical protein
VTIYKDLVIADLADDAAAIAERAVIAEADRDAYQLLAQQAIHSLHTLTAERDTLRAQLWRLRGEYRHLRAQTMRQAVAA